MYSIRIGFYFAFPALVISKNTAWSASEYSPSTLYVMSGFRWFCSRKDLTNRLLMILKSRSVLFVKSGGTLKDI